MGPSISGAHAGGEGAARPSPCRAGMGWNSSSAERPLSLSPRSRSRRRGLGARRPEPPPQIPDPTQQLTFFTPASRPHVGGGRTLWSDLTLLEAEAHLGEGQRRVVLTVLRTLRDPSGKFAGVLRLGLRRETIDRIVWEEQERARPNRILLCDEQGRLVSRLSPADSLAEQPDTNLRVVPAKAPEEIERALRDESLKRVGPDRLEDGGRFSVDGRPYLVSVRALPRTQDWRALVVVAEDELPGWAEQSRRRRRLAAFVLLLSAVILAGGILTLRTVRRGRSAGGKGEAVRGALPLPAPGLRPRSRGLRGPRAGGSPRGGARGTVSQAPPEPASRGVGRDLRRHRQVKRHNMISLSPL